MIKFSRWRTRTKFKYCDFPSKKWNYNKRYDLYKIINDEYIKDAPVAYLEFGVSGGHSFKWWIANQTNSESMFVGFDTYTGLPEDWNIYKKGDMSTGGSAPQVEDPRAQFVAGLFQDTMPDFIRNFDRENRTLIVHCDADLYSSTLYVFTSINSNLKPGDIILFDEFGVPTHEFKALLDFSSAYRIKLEPIVAFNRYMFTAFRVME